MGERKCAYEGCNALEFRTSGYCLRHKDGKNDEKKKDGVSVKSNPEPKTAYLNPEPKKIDDRPTSLGFKKGFFYTPLGLAIASLLLQDVCSVWLFFGAVIPPISYLNGRSQFSMGFAMGSIVGVLVFIIPWLSFTLQTDLICYDVVWSSNC
tara:strand:- start:176 stop:628 length:453 start_codon:yes stop_codon:yes gene_type:complete